MWINPKYSDQYAQRERREPREHREPPEQTGVLLASFSRAEGDEELRISQDDYKGHVFIAVRIWSRDRQTNAWYPTKRGASIRLRELRETVEALTRVLNEHKQGRQECGPAASWRDGAHDRGDAGQGSGFDEFRS
jgi:hypothetical protein